MAGSFRRLQASGRTALPFKPVAMTARSTRLSSRPTTTIGVAPHGGAGGSVDNEAGSSAASGTSIGLFCSGGVSATPATVVNRSAAATFQTDLLIDGSVPQRVSRLRAPAY